MHTGAVLRIDAAAIASNARKIADICRTEGSDVRMMAVVKADGFGHGTAALAALGAGATWLGVTSIAEALPFRWRGVSAPILSWLNGPDTDVDAALLHDIDLGVASTAQLVAVSAAAARTGRRARIHLHLDTGLARDGIDRKEWGALCELAALRHEYIEVVGVMSHLARADEPGHHETRKQVMLFRNALRAARHRGISPTLAHLAATAGAMTDPSTRFDMVRIGAGLYGIDPTRTLGSKAAPVLRGAMTLTAPVVALREVGAGTAVGYGQRYRTDRRTQLALIPIGYADGIPRAIGTRAHVMLGGRRVPIAGAVSMDQLVLDVGDTVTKVGAVATLFGPGDEGEPTLREWADWAGTIEHELMTHIGPRVSRQTIGVGLDGIAPITRRRSATAA